MTVRKDSFVVANAIDTRGEDSAQLPDHMNLYIGASFLSRRRAQVLAERPAAPNCLFANLWAP